MSYHKKRIQGDIRIIETQPLEGINICYDESNILTWHFLIFGLKGTEYEGGEYIGKIVFDDKYPDTSPEFYMHTPNGRFDVDKKICLSNSKFHKDEWQMSWTIHAIILSFVSVMFEDKDKGVSHIVRSSEERKLLAARSIEWNIKHMTDIYKKLKEDYLGHPSHFPIDKKNPQQENIDISDIKQKLEIINQLIMVHRIRVKKIKKHNKKTKKNN